MKTKSAPLILSNLMIGGLNKTCTFREITETNELERAFRFRYEEYSRSRLCRFLKQNQSKLDIDIYDLHSRHFGLFNGYNEMIGCLRVVMDKRKFYNNYVFEVGQKFNFFSKTENSLEGMRNSETADYPFLSYPNVPPSLLSHYNSLKARNVELAEASRLIIKENFRGFRTSAFLIDCAMMLFIILCSEHRHAVIDCCKDHRLFYERYGFRPFGDVTEYNLYDMNLDFICLALSETPKNLPVRIEEMKSQYQETGKISRAL
jgi:predicted GNAT family N-acyltransferase